MIRREDFIEAIGRPDAGFTEAVDSALAVIRAREERKKPRRYYMILPVAAAAVIFVVFMGFALRGGLAPKQPGSGNVLARPQNTAAATATPTPVESATPMPTLEAESPYVTYTPVPEAYPTAEPYDPNEVPGLTLEDAEITIIQYLFDGNVTALYPGFELTDITREVADGREVIARRISNGTYETAVKWIEISAPQHLPEYIADSYNGRKFYAVTLDVPTSAERIGLMMDTGYEWQKTIYEASLSRMEEIYGAAVRTDEYYMLTGMTVYLDENGIINYIEMFFGDDFGGYLLWRYESYDDGDFGYELLLDEYGPYIFNDIFGDPTVSATVEPTPAPVSINLKEQLVGFNDEASMEKILNAYLPLLQALTPKYDSYSFSYDSVFQNGIEMDCYALRMYENEVAAWIAMDAPEYASANGETYYTLNIPVALSMSEIDNAVNAGDALTAAVYEESKKLAYEYAAEAGRAEKDMLLCGIKLYLDDYVTPVYCEMFFGGELQHRSLWSMGDDVAEILETGVNDVRFDYSFAAAPDVTYDISSSLLSDLAAKISGALGIDRSIGIIGGADGPTQIMISSVVTEKTAEYPDEYALFENAFGVELAGFYPGYEPAGQLPGLVSARGMEFDCDYWLLSDGNSEISAAWLTRGEITQSDRETGTIKSPTLSVIMPEDPELIDAVMLNSHAYLADTYYKCRDYACEMLGDPSAMYKGWELAGIKVTFDANDQPFMYEFYFGSDRKIYFMFVREADGDFAMQQQYFDETGEYFSEYFGVPVKGLPATDMRMFEFTFGQSIDALYPGNDGIYIEGDNEYAVAKVKYGSGDVEAWSLSRGKLWENSGYADGEDFVSVNAFIPGDSPERVEAFMDGCPDWLYEIYTADLNSGMYKPLTHVIVTYTPEGDLCACEMIFDDGEETYYERWLLSDSGEFTVVETGGGIPAE